MTKLHPRWRDLAQHKLKDTVTDCPNCRHNEYKIDSVVRAPLEREDVAFSTSGGGTPGTSFVVVPCTKCGFVRLFLAEPLGLLV